MSGRQPRSAPAMRLCATPRNAGASPSTRSSATSPAPIRLAASPCSHTAAAAAANGSMPCAKQPKHHAGENIAAARRRQVGRRVGVDRSPAVGRGDHRVGALQHDDRAALPRRPPRPLELAAARVEQARKFALMRRHHHRRTDRREQGLRVLGERGQRIGIEHRPLAGCEDRQGLVAGLGANSGARADQRGVSSACPRATPGNRRARRPAGR